MRARLGVDIGGTFTDLVVIDEATGTARVGKVLTTTKDPAHGVEEGIHALLDEAGVRSDAVRAVVHGTTLATNALIERKGAKTALLTTEGFRDALEIRREGRYDMYDLFIDPPPPLSPRPGSTANSTSCNPPAAPRSRRSRGGSRSVSWSRVPPRARWRRLRRRASVTSRSSSRSTWAARPRKRASSTTASRSSGASSRWRAPTGSRRARGSRSAFRSSS